MVNLEELRNFCYPTTTLSTPTTSGQQVENKYKPFTPLIDDASKIQCNVCLSKFGYKSSYELHMVTYHPNNDIDVTITDPKGTCRMINRITKKPCLIKYSIRSIYGHLQRKHGTIRPSEYHNLIGFYTGETTSAAFLLKGKRDIKDAILVEDLFLKKLKGEKVETQELNIEEENMNLFSAPLGVSTRKKRKIQSSSKQMLCDDTPLSKRVKMRQSNFQDKLVNIEFQNNTINSSFEYCYEKTPVVITTNETTMNVKPCCVKLNNKEVSQILNQNYEFENQSSSPMKLCENVPSGPVIDDFNMSAQLDVEKSGSQAYYSMEDFDLCHEADSDFDENDDNHFTERRMKNKHERYLRRNSVSVKIHELSENAIFIADMKEYMQNESIASKYLDNSTIKKTINHLFIFDDSLLMFEYKENKDFNLNMLRNFNEDTFKNLKYPLSWLTKTVLEEDGGGKGHERLKAHNNLRRFLEYEVDKIDNMKRKLEIKSNLANITKQIERNKLFQKYGTLVSVEAKKKKKCQLILNRDKKFNEENIMMKWNMSLEKESLDEDMNFIYKQCILEDSPLSPRQLTSYAEYARLNLAFSDKNRYKRINVNTPNS